MPSPSLSKKKWTMLYNHRVWKLMQSDLSAGAGLANWAHFAVQNVQRCSFFWNGTHSFATLKLSSRRTVFFGFQPAWNCVYLCMFFLQCIATHLLSPRVALKVEHTATCMKALCITRSTMPPLSSLISGAPVTCQQGKDRGMQLPRVFLKNWLLHFLTLKCQIN